MRRGWLYSLFIGITLVLFCSVSCTNNTNSVPQTVPPPIQNAGCQQMSGGIAPTQIVGSCASPPASSNGGGCATNAAQSVGYYTPGPADVCITLAQAPAPFNPSGDLSILGAIALPNLIGPTTQGFQGRTSSQASKRINLGAQVPLSGGDHEFLGVGLATATFMNGSRYTAITALETVYEALQRPFVSQGPVTGVSNIYAPTLRFGTCFETSSNYVGDGSVAGSTANFTVWNFCLPTQGMMFKTSITADFINRYVRINPANSLPSYAMETFTPDSSIGVDSVWYAILYNYQTTKWDLVETAHSTYKPEGWSADEGWFAQGACPIEAPFASDAVRVYDANSASWGLLQPTMPDGLTSNTDTIATEASTYGNFCLTNTIQITVQQPNSSWLSISPQPYIAPQSRERRLPLP